MKRKKRDKTLIWIGLAVVAVLIFWYAGEKGWFKSSFSITNPEQQSIQPDQNQLVYSSCSQVCSQNGFSLNYASSNCKEEETKIVYGYTGQSPILTCCCYNQANNPPPQSTCTDTDNGRISTTPGTVTASDGTKYMDYCFDENTVYEYACNGNEWTGGKMSCEPGQVCISSRSGGYCKTKTWSPGDTVVQGGGSGIITGGSQGYSEIDLSKYGVAIGGGCQLGAKLDVNWNYANDKCSGIMGMAGMIWEFYDSNGLEYTKTDLTPTAWSVDLHPRGHILNWDGHTPWRAIARQTSPILPECIINYNYNARIYIYDCL